MLNKKNIIIFVICFITIFLVNSLEIDDWNKEKEKAELKFKKGEYDEAIIIFREIILSSNNEELKRESYFWIAKAYIAIDKLNQAQENLEFYIKNYKETGKNYGEALYQKGRLLFLQEQYESAIEQLDYFRTNYPDHELISNSYYWIGESLYALGQFDDSALYFKIVVNKYVKSHKYDASVYKLRLIEHKKSELALQNLLKWSQEQYLSSLNQFRIKEKTLEEALLKYKNALKGDENIVLNEDYQELIKEKEELLKKVGELESLIESLQEGDNTDYLKRLEQLELKEKLLNSKEETLKLLEEELRKKEESLEN